MKAYYNEHDPKAAAWIRELIKEGLVAPGDVDERSIEDVVPDELRKYTQLHWFAGIAVWSHALRRAGWPDDRPVWTGSCPCQPFSTAGKGEGFDDERHLWPAWFHLIDSLRPDTIFGEQVSSKDGLTWLDLVQDDLEGAGYTFRALDIPACSVGAPHRRSRFYFVADSAGVRLDQRWQGAGYAIKEGRQPRSEQVGQLAGRLEGSRTTRILANTLPTGRSERWPESGNGQIARSGESYNVADADGRRREQRYEGQWDVQEPDAGCSTSELGYTVEQGLEGLAGNERDRNEPGRIRADEIGSIAEAGPTNGFWRNAEWIYCRDKKYRAVEPGTFPLAHGSPARVGRLRGFGNAIVAPLAEEFIKAYLGE